MTVAQYGQQARWRRQIASGLAFLYRAGDPLPGGVFTRATTATEIDAGFLVSPFASGVLRDSHYATAPTMGQVYRSTLLEGARTNRVLQSAQMDTTWTVTGGLTRTGGQADPAGGTSAWLLADVASGNDSLIAPPTFVGDGTKTFSVYAKAGTATQSYLAVYDSTAVVTRYDVQVNWSGGVPSMGTASGSGTSFTPIPLGSGWYRLAIAANSVTAANANRLYIKPSNTAQNKNSTWFGGMGEDAAFPSSYIPTTTAAVTRNADALSATFLPVPQAMTLYARGVFSGAVDGTTNYTLMQVGAQGGNYCSQRIDGTTLKASSVHAGGATRGGDLTSTALVAGDLFEVRTVLVSDGSIFTGMSINGGAESVSAASAGTSFAATWGTLAVQIGSLSTAAQPGFSPLTHIGIGLGPERSVAAMRAAVGV